MMTGASIAIAALLLIIPGFLTDFIGFLLLIPFTRKILFNLTIKNRPRAETKDQDKTIDGEIIDNNTLHVSASSMDIEFMKCKIK